MIWFHFIFVVAPRIIRFDIRKAKKLAEVLE